MGTAGDGSEPPEDDAERIRKQIERSAEFGSLHDRFVQCKEATRNALFNSLANPRPAQRPYTPLSNAEAEAAADAVTSARQAAAEAMPRLHRIGSRWMMVNALCVGAPSWGLMMSGHAPAASAMHTLHAWRGRRRANSRRLLQMMSHHQLHHHLRQSLPRSGERWCSESLQVRKHGRTAAVSTAFWRYLSYCPAYCILSIANCFLPIAYCLFYCLSPIASYRILPYLAYRLF